MSFTHSRRVRFIECDPQRRANNAHYLSWIDDAFYAWLCEAGDLYDRLHHNGLMYVLAHAELDYLGAARFDQRLDTSVSPRAMGRTSLAVEFRIRRCPEGDEVFVGRVRYVCVDARGERPAPWPAEVVAAVQGCDGSVGDDPLTREGRTT